MANPMLVQLNVDIDMCQNPKVRCMFTNADACQEMNAFLDANRLKVENTFATNNVVTRIELRGSTEGLVKFRETYLASEEPAVVYELRYV